MNCTKTHSLSFLAYRARHHQVVTCGQDGWLKIWSPFTGELVMEKDMQQKCWGADLSDDERYLLTSHDDHTFRIWDLAKLAQPD